MEKLKTIEFPNEYGLKDIWNYRGNRLIRTEMQYPKTKTKIKQKQKPMSKKQELFEQISSLYQTFEAEHNGTTKKSQSNARKAIGEIKKLITDYRKESVAESK